MVPDDYINDIDDSIDSLQITFLPEANIDNIIGNSFFVELKAIGLLGFLFILLIKVLLFHFNQKDK